jgi:predicted membrane-bound dolichyl-phosphate-mannose-protein mannosyltransferase
MIGRVLRFLRLPFLLIFLFAVARFSLGLAGVPYAPRGNAVFSVVMLSIISCIYFGALSKKVGGFGWLGVILIGVCIGLFSQILIFTATLISYLAGVETYYTHWDALNVPEGTRVPMGQALATRAGGLIGGPITTTISALIGRLLSALAPGPVDR